jgi:hypothetical protein
MGQEREYGVPAPREEMVSLGGSVFGSSYFVATPVGEHKLIFRPASHSHNWNPQRLSGQVLLLSMSISNVVTYLRGAGGESYETLRYTWPGEPDDFQRPWTESVSIEWSNFDTVVTQGDVDACTKEEILAGYNEAFGG